MRLSLLILRQSRAKKEVTFSSVLVLVRLPEHSGLGEIITMFRHLRNLQQVSRRTLSSTARRQLENKVPVKQKMFQEDNGMPVHLKGGTTDALLYRATMALTVFGCGYVLYALIDAALPKKKA
ncbi:cytochrome c oxidase subunit 7A2, mitochondrial-like [Cyprinus carpio]|uniref:Cytochrome c oxidase subunit 7A2, mitochondrial-like n=1 Tax=Cyprinus carpio TaxID=7962 RepID=A0A9Q9V827_CYPCA|nr:cytochrome c oxidase subunit 7A2, mitochondrial-like [Cyprinus carpio]